MLHDISELRRLERMRTEFVANVSHELRTPLTSLMGYLETLDEGGTDNEPQAKQFLQICRRHAENLSRIVQDLLRLSRLENPQQEIATTRVELKDVIKAGVEQCATPARARSIVVTVEAPNEDAFVAGDRGLLVQALCNLIENAINYNHEHGSVRIRLSRSGLPAAAQERLWEISVADTGIGIPAEAMQHVFERFYRVDKARSKERGGTGLGLAIVKHIALAHGASVHVESELGKGSTFSIRFGPHAHLDSTLSQDSLALSVA